MSAAEGSPLVERIPAALDGERLDRVVSLIAGCSRGDAAALVAGGAVALDGVRRHRRQAAGGSRPDAERRPDRDPAARRCPSPDPSVPVDVVYEDDDVIVIDKPAGLVVHPGAGQQSTGTLVNGLLARYPEMAGVGEAHRPGIVHRLDRDTSGLLVVARTAEAYSRLVDALADPAGHAPLPDAGRGACREAPHGVIDAPIGRSPRHPTRMAVVAGGRPARTRYEVRATYREPARVRAARAASSRPAARTRSGCTWPPSGIRWSATATYGGVRPGAIAAARPFLHAARTSAFGHPVRPRAAPAFDSPLARRPGRGRDDLGLGDVSDVGSPSHAERTCRAVRRRRGRAARATAPRPGPGSATSASV